MQGRCGSGRLRKAASGLLCSIAGLSCAHLTVTSATADQAASLKPVPAVTLTALRQKSVVATAPIYMRIFKEDSELEVWKARADGRYVHVKTFPICNWSGALGPKTKLGDQMAPEGFYSFSADGLKPDSKYHLAINVGYPNALDRALGRSGDFIMVHGKCASIGCFAMTDDLIEEVYALARDAIGGGQERIPLHIFPFHMTAAKMQSHVDHPARASWAPLKEAYEDFAKTQIPPRTGACGKHYVVNPIAPLDGNAADACPSRLGKLLAMISPKKARKLAAANTPLIAEGPKTRTIENISGWDGSSARAMMLGVSQREDSKQARKDAASSAPIGNSMAPFLDAVK
jgi:murein L,D-transpeptidase YafK